jgi:hypothetical protein
MAVAPARSDANTILDLSVIIKPPFVVDATGRKQRAKRRIARHTKVNGAHAVQRL